MAKLRIDAVIFDLDGVVTDTAATHASAWKTVFDAFLEARGRRDGRRYDRFDIDEDYRRYVGGRPRYDGVRTFLRARGIELPEGTPEDPPDAETVCGLGNRKAEVFQAELTGGGVESFRSTVILIRHLKKRGIGTAIISASRNRGAVLRAAGLDNLFDVAVDGTESDRLGLEGKPAPDIFLEAARRLGVGPDSTAVVEDALAGVEAGRTGNFACVIGVDRTGHPGALADQGADVVVPDLAALDLREIGLAHALPPSALEHRDEIGRRLSSGRPIVILDYDGTLTPIVERPELARLDPSMKARVAALAEDRPVAVFSGRDLRDIRALVGLDTLFYAGSHGFEIQEPGGRTRAFASDIDYPGIVTSAAAELRERLSGIEGAIVEEKTFTVAVHYRLVAPDALPRIDAAIADVASRHPELRTAGGKKVFELRPDVDWNKGRAIRWFLEALDMSDAEAIPLYIGDDLTDEDAFELLDGWGVSIAVAEPGCATIADYRLANPEQVGVFLERLNAALGDGSP